MCIRDRDGVDGQDGAPGRDGADGADGQDGAPGERGAKGPAGKDGQDGAPGERGERGPQGERGSQGEKGDRGDRGPQGESGPQGEPGQRGPKGPAGGLEASTGEFAIPAWDGASVGDSDSFDGGDFGMVTWTITNVGGANAQGNACMQITYTFSDRGAATAAFMQEMNRRDGAAGKVGLSLSLIHISEPTRPY